MRVTVYETQDVEAADKRIVVIAGQHGALVLAEWEAREACGMLPNVLDPITPDKPEAHD